MTTRILIVDDDQDIRKLLGHRLKADGFEPIFAGDAISAVNQARKERPDLIPLDLMLPAATATSSWSGWRRCPHSRACP